MMREVEHYHLSWLISKRQQHYHLSGPLSVPQPSYLAVVQNFLEQLNPGIIIPTCCTTGLALTATFSAMQTLSSEKIQSPLYICCHPNSQSPLEVGCMYSTACDYKVHQSSFDGYSSNEKRIRFSMFLQLFLYMAHAEILVSQWKCWSFIQCTQRRSTFLSSFSPSLTTSPLHRDLFFPAPSSYK